MNEFVKLFSVKKRKRVKKRVSIKFKERTKKKTTGTKRKQQETK